MKRGNGLSVDECRFGKRNSMTCVRKGTKSRGQGSCEACPISIPYKQPSAKRNDKQAGAVVYYRACTAGKRAPPTFSSNHVGCKLWTRVAK